MARTSALLVLLTLCVTLLRCELRDDRPALTTQDGNLVLRPALGKNIHLRTNGPGSTILLAGFDVRAALANLSLVPRLPDFNVPDLADLRTRIERLELEMHDIPTPSSSNYTNVLRRVNALSTRLSRLQRRVDNLARDECASRPCRNGGTCLQTPGSHYCICPAQWEGEDCEVDVNECRNFASTDLGCQNGATCINRLGSYECICRSGWYGIHCTRKAKDCSGGDFEMCGHGICVQVSTGEGVRCICEQGWTNNGTSLSCLTDVDECAPGGGAHCSINPRVQCLNVPGSFRCGACPSGYEGDGYTCTDIDECVAQPNGGCSTSPMVPCYNTLGSRVCGACPSGYIGDGITCEWRGSCDVNHGGCHPSAQCIDEGSVSRCICPRGAEGDGVGLHGCYISTGNVTQNCEDNPCGPHGRCHEVRYGFTCFCDTSYSGLRCDTRFDSCASAPCLHGGICHSDETLPRGFRCECTAYYAGDICQTRERSCGGVIDAMEGNIAYPLTNDTSYGHNVRCAWVVHTTPDKVINVTFTKFDVEYTNDCAFDFLQIHDGRSSANQLIGRFCGTELPKSGNIVSSHNNLYFWFRTDASIARNGFALHWNSIAPSCGGDVNANVNGIIHSPGSPGRYPPNRDCSWKVSVDLGKRIQLHFFQLDLENHPNCSFDYLEIFDGENSIDPLLGRYCNTSVPAPLQSAGSKLLIHFHSDAFGSGGGFQISYAASEGVPGCGGYFTADKGELVSPTYNGKYMDNLLCDYQLRSAPNTNIQLTFESFQLENSRNCQYDYVKIYDGPSEDSSLVGKFCGQSYPRTYISSSNTLYIQFKSDFGLSFSGFRITYKTLCRTILSGDSGVITSPGYPNSYPVSQNCEYIIHVAPGKAIQLTFVDLDLEGNRYFRCIFDYVEIYDGADGNATLLGRYCGGSQRMPPVQTSTLNYMYVKFVSDSSLTGIGFYANYTTVDTECGGIHKNSTGLINYPSSSSEQYKDNTDCIWILDAPPGRHIKITWNRFDIEVSATCSADYLQLIEVNENNEENDLGKYCGGTAPSEIMSFTNRLKIKFHSDLSFRGTGFSFSYTFLDAGTRCGGTYRQVHGYIHAPGWPNRYEPNRDCTWTITVPVGQQITLNVSKFDLESPIRNNCLFGDYLEIRNGLSQSSALIGIYCGTFIPKRIISFSNSLYLHFYSDYYLGGEGFNIEWDGYLSGCGGTLTGSSGSISSPNYPQPYGRNSECFYRVIVNPGSRIRFSFTDLDLENTVNCRDDYVQIFDGRDLNSAILGKFCVMNARVFQIETTSNYAYLKFRSDYALSGKGFYLNYETVCTSNITGTHGVVESPNFPNNYPLNLNCSWTIIAPKGSKINITFTHFDISRTIRRHWNRPGFDIFYPGGNCTFDYLQFKEGNQPNFNDKLCGSIQPEDIHTSSEILQIKFITQSRITRTGFRLEWLAETCGGEFKKDYGYFSLKPGSIPTSGPVECLWKIETSPGTAVQLTIHNVFMKDTQNCTSDVIEIYDGSDITSPLITKVCHQTSTTTTSSTSVMLVKFVRQSDLQGLSFEANYHTSTAKCGGTFSGRSGTFTSLNFPKNYENNLDCVWTLNVPRSHLIDLSFPVFDLYDLPSFRNDPVCGDYVRIYEGYDIIGSNYSHQLCPKSNETRILSKSNILSVQFISDGYGSAMGFKANFNMFCGGTITIQYDGILTNDDMPLHFIGNCSWTIVAEQLDQKISLTITHMTLPRNDSIETSRHCPSSFLRIRDGNDELAPLIGEYCGRKVPPMIVSRGNTLIVQLGSYNGPIAGKFTAHYSALATACGGSLTSEEGTIASPNYPDSYPATSNCEWILNTSPGNKVYITFEFFSIEDSENCNEDYLEIRENDSAGQLVNVYCGDNKPLNTTVASKLFIKFHSDGTGTGRGFVAHYGFIHGNDISGIEHGEIASPFYPQPYIGQADYSWRISTDMHTQIHLSIDLMEIAVTGTVCYNYLSIYDGYDDNSLLLKEVCGLTQDPISITSSSNTIYIKFKLDETNFGSRFHISWNMVIENNEVVIDEGVNCGFNHTTYLVQGNSTEIMSPNFPEPYGSNLKCEWIFKTDPGSHLTVKFNVFNLEETSSCFADSVSIYNSKTGGVDWEIIRERICLSDIINTLINATTFLKIKFISDTSITKSGFSATVRADCGGSLTALSGVVKSSWLNWQSSGHALQHCEWSVRARPGRTLDVTISFFNITNSGTVCQNHLTLRNGESIESPLLGLGKFCGYPHEDRQSSLQTTTNALYIVYHLQLAALQYQAFSLHYEEQHIECGVTSQLDVNNQWEIINSPNYPSVPTPFTECVWKFSAPPEEILKVNFIDRFDLERKVDCDDEFIEIRDGASEMSPLRGRYCTEKPSTIKSSGNYIYIKYVTQLAEPRNGFKANISIDICGGTINANEGEITSPGYPKLAALSYGTVCEWRIISRSGRTIMIKPQDISLPEPENHDSMKITIEELIPLNQSTFVVKTLYYNDNGIDLNPVETMSREVVIKFYFSKPSQYSVASSVRGFRFTFNSSRLACGGKISTAEGYITTPGYPREVHFPYCRWSITVPNPSRRIRLEILDSNFMENYQEISLYNDLYFVSIIQTFSNQNWSSTNIFESSSNHLVLAIWTVQNRGLVSATRLKARFSSDEPALCGGTISGKTGEIISLGADKSYACEWHITNSAESINVDIYKSASVNIKFNTSDHNTELSHCRYRGPKINLLSNVGNGNTFRRTVCATQDVTYRVPVSVFDIKAFKGIESYANFSIDWKMNPCGGTVEVGVTPIDILKLPNITVQGSLDCGWTVTTFDLSRIQLRLEGSFEGSCEDEFILVSLLRQSSLNSRYCRDQQPSDVKMLVGDIYVEYHNVNYKNNTNLKFYASKTSISCGGLISTYNSVFASPNYPNGYSENQECIWEIIADNGNRVMLQFLGRFAIEYTVNCTKDAVIIYDWKDQKYIEIGRVCGRTRPTSYNSTFNQMKVILRTDATNHLDGFQAQWTDICGGEYNVTETEQVLYSPGYPSGYKPFLDCEYKLNSPTNKILIKFLDFALEGPYPLCNYDNLTLSGSRSHFYYGSDIVLCGTDIPKPRTFYDSVTLHFKSDMYANNKGFKISYAIQTCSRTITQPTIITSGNDETENYESDLNCTWTIRAPPDKRVVLNFIFIDLENNYQCYSDYIAVFEGPTIVPEKRLALLCGHMNPTVVRSTGNDMIIQFVSDYSVGYKGFKADISFSYNCGGQVNLTNSQTKIFSSPLFNHERVYAEYLDCHWAVTASPGKVIQVEFTSFHIAPCRNVNQTALGTSKCDCDFVEIIDGINPNSLLIGRYCGHNTPPRLLSSDNTLGMRLSTDGELSSSGFTVRLSERDSPCGQNRFSLSRNVQIIKSPGYDGSGIPKSLHCYYYLSNTATYIHLRVNNMDLQNGSAPNMCDKDMVVIRNVMHADNTTFGVDFISHQRSDPFYDTYNVYYNILSRAPQQIVLCGTMKSIDFYFSGDIKVHLITASEAEKVHKGVELEVSYVSGCSRNYTDEQGRVQVDMSNAEECSILISAPANTTVTLYFFYIIVPWETSMTFQILDGDSLTAPVLRAFSDSNSDVAIFSTGPKVLIRKSGGSENPGVSFDLNYYSTDKGQGCGGRLHNIVGTVSSPLYPNTYRHFGSCEWVLETPATTRLKLNFKNFDLGPSCDQNYVQLVDRNGKVFSTYCEEMPADYISDDNYVKIVFTTTMNNSGSGWVAQFIGITPY